MSYPGEDDSRAPGNWSRVGSGYWPAGARRSDPVRGFPPVPGSGDPQYASTVAGGPNGAGGGPPGESGAHRPVEAGAAANAATAGSAGPGKRAAAGPGAPARAWSTEWGGGPWSANAVDGSWSTDIMAAAGVDGAGDAATPHTWTYGEDDPTETWTLRQQGNGQPEPAHQSGVALAGGDTAATGRTAPFGGAAGRSDVARRARQPAAGGLRGGEATRAQRAGGSRGKARKRGGGRSRAALVAVVTLATTAIAATGVYTLTLASHSNAPAAVPTQAAPPSPSPSATASALGKWLHIGSRADDPVPLTLAELFPAQVSVGTRGYVLTAERASQNCAQAVFGSKLKAAVSKGCTQALRASYVSSNGKRMGTVGVLNLATSDAASVGRVVAAPRQFIEPLPARRGVTANLGKGTGVVWAAAKGHYLILMWVEFTSLRSPSTSRDRSVLMQFVNDLYEMTVNQSLTRRMVTGSPLTP